MTPHDDVQPAIEAAIRHAVGSDFRIGWVEASSGNLHRTLVVIGDDDRSRYFVKVAGLEALERFEAEADGLAALRATDTFRVPDVIATTASNTSAMLILEHIALRPLGDAVDGERFAGALVRMHRQCAERFGWSRDNHIGTTPQENAPMENWAHFFAERRLKPQLLRAHRRGFGSDLLSLGEKLIERLPALFLEYRPRPSLLHGDLWHGNAAMSQSGEPVIYDPATYHGDRETDIAMSELFGRFPANFYASYRLHWPLDPGYETRKPLYNLYHMLNHLNLFGRSYLGEVQRLTATLVRKLG